MADDTTLPTDQLDLLLEPAPWDEGWGERDAGNREQETTPQDKENGAGG